MLPLPGTPGQATIGVVPTGRGAADDGKPANLKLNVAANSKDEWSRAFLDQLP
jgi:hypothetical protein